ncbi:MAG: hypothetical protein DRI74_05355 [Bacteroidetes bacterium]|nr:MAG: hypothetical protein DRI74_05355 [Bacteroidota bacterium]
MKRTALIFLFVITFQFVFAQKRLSFAERLNTLEGVEVEVIPSFDSLYQTFKISIEQPIDHNNPEDGVFLQKIYLSHFDLNQPIVLVTEGYQAKHNYLTEPAQLLNANQIIVEHRFFGESVPDSLDWTKLTTFQAASDHHRIVELFKEIYAGKWISTGISKGGQTTIYYRYYFPDDVTVSIPYVAPLNIEQEDPRINLFLRNVGTPECRAKLLGFQRKLLAKETEILPLLKRFKEQNNIVFTQSDGLVFEFAVLELPFTFWQWAPFSCKSLDDVENSAGALFHKLKKAGILNAFSVESQSYYLPFLVQAYQEIGYYNFDVDSLKSQLNYVTDPSNAVFLPDSLRLPYLDNQMEKVHHWLENNGNNFLYIYGELDPWVSTSPNPDSRTNALKMVLPGGSHATRLKDFTEKEQKRAVDLIKSWLDEKE